MPQTKTNEPPPLVSIGLPVYNGADFIVPALSSMLAQDYENLEIVICDDASTDRTEEICKSFAERDHRIRYFRNSERTGIFPNSNRVIRLSKGEYFMLTGHHDRWDPHLISTLVSEFSRNPSAVICSGHTVEHDDNDKLFQEVPPIDTRGLNRWERIKKLFNIFWSDSALYGLMRMDALRKTPLFRLTFAADFLLVANMALLGEFCFVPNAKTYLRARFGRKMTASENMIRFLGVKHSNTKMGKFIVRFPNTYAVWMTFHFILTSSLSVTEKMKLAYIVMFLESKYIFLASKTLLVQKISAVLPKNARLWFKDLRSRLTKNENQSYYKV